MLACVVTCGGLCPGLNTVIREIVCGLSYMYGVNRVLGIEVWTNSGLHMEPACFFLCFYMCIMMMKLLLYLCNLIAY